MTAPDKLVARLIMLLAILFGTLSIALFALAPAGSFRIFQPQWPLAGVLCWDALLSLLFFLQHSGMVRRGFRARAAGFVPPRYYPAVYAIASGVALAALVLLWQPSGRHLLVLDGLSLRITQAGALGAFAFFLWGGFALRGFDPFGLSPLRAYLRGQQEQRPAFVVRGPYQWVRHPLYFSILLLIWLSPDLTVDRLLFNTLWTAWIWIGTVLEERDLTHEFGDAYRQYRRTVPKLIPWRLTGRPREHGLRPA
jgi:methanethiol S-methyltransferase